MGTVSEDGIWKKPKEIGRVLMNIIYTGFVENRSFFKSSNRRF